ncbi:hypothetical protein TEA_024837 [Camellia sinensis var. sinensis]|uniref:RING-type domain-containing protein n=1 Tax=Camellia sinensis var. sinensis TaxID=542762 RepID=A0A4S4ECG5_CAMSN|nr:hypothetical protein TEA_024837 [Camellia sinensis var. sinensis]
MAQPQSISDLKTLVNPLISDLKTLDNPSISDDDNNNKLVVFVDDHDDNSSVPVVDDFYFSALSNENEDQMFPISDSKYAEELQLQEALMSSVIASKSSVPPLMKIDEKAKAEEVGESSHGFCEICVEKKEADEMFRIDTCSHSFCSDCISKHVTMKIQDHITVVSCPTWDCSGVLQLDDCRPRMSRDVIERWDEVLCESMIPASEKFYCPFKDCSFMLVNDNGEEVIRECVDFNSAMHVEKLGVKLMVVVDHDW